MATDSEKIGEVKKSLEIYDRQLRSWHAMSRDTNQLARIAADRKEEITINLIDSIRKIVP